MFFGFIEIFVLMALRPVLLNIALNISLLFSNVET